MAEFTPAYALDLAEQTLRKVNTALESSPVPEHVELQIEVEEALTELEATK